MKEELLQYIWKNKIFNHQDLRTTDGHEIRIINPGLLHHDAGPDFKQAVIRIDDMIWAGDVEIHINGSDWYKHHHQKDDKYLSVILHVVYHCDMDIIRKDQELIPTLELKNYIPPEVMEEYKKLTLSTQAIACGESIGRIRPLVLNSIFSSLAVDRLIRRQHQLLRLLNQCTGNWNELTYRTLAVNFGFNVNGTAFELLAQSMPYRIIERHSGSRLQVYSLVFGQAGMLDADDIDDNYYHTLKDEYDYLKYKYKLIPIERKLWNLLRLRPTNFPCIRLAQFSEVLFCLPDIFNELIINTSVDALQAKFSGINPDEYWQHHFQFGKPTKKHHCHIGKTALDLLIINTLAPILFTYGSFCGKEDFQSAGLGLLENCEAENNIITRQFGKYDFPNDSAMTTQAMLELYSSFCKKKKCYSCPIGQYVVTNLYGSNASPPA